jgi:ceramide glucosyltransferase
MHRLLQLIEIISVIGTISSIAYYLLSLYSARTFLRVVRPPRLSTFPPVTILKPLKGTDPEMYESFRSHCLQDYGEYEIIFGVSDPNDPAIVEVQRLQTEFAGRNIRLINCDNILGANVKISNLVQMLSSARYDHLVVNDSDIRVPADYLQNVIAPLTDPSTGLVTCLYRAVAAPTLGSKLEAIGISSDFAPGVLVARQLEGIRFGLGSTLAFRRETLRQIGGFESLLDYLADDYQLGKRIAGQSLKVELSSSIVETYLPAYKFLDFLRHQIRWARTIRDSRPAGYFGLIFTFGLPWAALALITARGAPWAWTLLAVTAAARLTVAFTVGKRVLGDGQLPADLWLIPIRDFIAVFVWLASFAGHTVSWRGDLFTLKKGKLARI